MMAPLTRCNAKSFARSRITSHGSPSDCKFIFHLKFSSSQFSSHFECLEASEWKSYFMQASPTLRVLGCLSGSGTKSRVAPGQLNNELHTILKRKNV